MLPSQWLAWKRIEAVRSCLASRLAARVPTPQKRSNVAQFLEVDLRWVFRKPLAVADISEQDCIDMESAARDLLESLDELVNEQLVDDTENGQEQPEGWELEPAADVPALPEAAILGDAYPRLCALIMFLEKESGELNLATGPGPPAFVLPRGASGALALRRVDRWKALLERLEANTRTTRSNGAPLDAASYGHFNTDFEKPQPCLLEKRASIILGAVFSEFRRLNCENGRRLHEVRLKVCKELYEGAFRPVLDTFVSCCRYEEESVAWQEAECGIFDVTLDEEESPSVCLAIEKARSEGNKLRLLADRDRGLFDVSGKMPSVQSSSQHFESLISMLRGEILSRVKIKEALQGKVNTGRKLKFAEKARLALSLAWCLLDFIDEDLELAAHSWNPEHIFFVYPKDKTAREGTLFVSLKLRGITKESSVASEEDLLQSIRPGNPVLLSFARLLLEIYDGDELSITTHHDNATLNLKAWGQLCDALENAEADGRNHFLSAVYGCLNLRVYLRNEIEKGFTADLDVLRRVMYENIVRNLELAADLERIKRKREWNDSKIDHHSRPFKKTTSNQVSKPGANFTAATFPQSDCGAHFSQASNTRKCFPPPEMRHIKTPRRRMEGPPLQTSPVTEAIAPTPKDLLRSPHTVTLYDDHDTGNDVKESEMAMRYFAHLQDLKDGFILPFIANGTVSANDKKVRRPVRVAILDSGVDMADPYVSGAATRIKAKRNWTDDDSDNWTDTYGHGTQVARLLIRVAPAADIYIARVSTGKHVAPERTSQIAQAIKWAATQWNVDIISLSLGLNDADEEIELELERVLNPGGMDGRKRIVVAASANWAGNHDVAYPARRERVICINATDGGGNPSKWNPTPRKGKKNFSILGLSIESWRRARSKEPVASEEDVSTAPAPAGLIEPKSKQERVWISGTSYATPIAAGVVANVLEFMEHHAQMTVGERETLCSWFGMSRIFEAMSTERHGYDYITPWKMFRPERDVQTIVMLIRRILDGETPREVC